MSSRGDRAPAPVVPVEAPCCVLHVIENEDFGKPALAGVDGLRGPLLGLVTNCGRCRRNGPTRRCPRCGVYFCRSAA
jgi:hypothetical protein